MMTHPDALTATQQNALATELAELCIKRGATLRESRNALTDAAGELDAMLDGPSDLPTAADLEDRRLGEARSLIDAGRGHLVARGR